MTEFGTEPSFRAYLQILRRRKWWVGSIAVLGLAASLAFSLTAHKQYSATAQLLVQPSIDASGLGVTQPQPVTQTDVETELQLVTSAPVQQAVRAQLGSTPAVSASEVGQTNVIAITATSQVPSRASLVANLYANAFVQYRQAVAEPQPGDRRGAAALADLLARPAAQAPSGATRPRRRRRRCSTSRRS